MAHELAFGLGRGRHTVGQYDLVRRATRVAVLEDCGKQLLYRKSSQQSQQVDTFDCLTKPLENKHLHF